MAKYDKTTQIVKNSKVAKRRNWPKKYQIGQKGKNAKT